MNDEESATSETKKVELERDARGKILDYLIARAEAHGIHTGNSWYQTIDRTMEKLAEAQARANDAITHSKDIADTVSDEIGQIIEGAEVMPTVDAVAELCRMHRKAQARVAELEAAMKEAVVIYSRDGGEGQSAWNMRAVLLQALSKGKSE